MRRSTAAVRSPTRATTPPAPWESAKKYEIACPRSSNGKISLTVRYADDAPAEAKKKITHQNTVWVVAESMCAWNIQAETTSSTPDTP